MKKGIRQLGIAALGLALILGLGGCGLFVKSYNYNKNENSIYVGSIATVKSAIVGDFDKDYYDIEELKGVACDQILEFNKDNYGCSYYTYDQMTKEERKTMLLPVSFDSIEKSGTKVSVVLEYANGDTYTSFNKVLIEKAGGSKVYTSTLQNNTMSLDGSFVSKDGSQTVTAQDFADKKDYCVVYADFDVTVYGEHEIAYVSPNVTVTGNNSAQIKGNDGAYIIFK